MATFFILTEDLGRQVSVASMGTLFRLDYVKSLLADVRLNCGHACSMRL